MTLLCLAGIWLAGFGLVRWMFALPLRWSLHNVILFSLGIGVGAGIASCLSFLSLVLAGPNLTVLVSALCGAVVACLALGLSTRRVGTPLAWAESPGVPWYLSAAFGLAIALAAVAFLYTVSHNPHGDEGAWSIWNLRARFLFRAGGLWREAFSNDLSWSHLDYPLLLPALVAMCWKIAGRESTDAAVAIAFLFGAGTVGVLTGTLGVLRGKLYALIGGTLLLGAASFLSLSAALYGDVPLSFYILATLALLCLQERHPDDLRFSTLAGLMAGFAAWTRNEGIIFLAAVIVARAVAMLRNRERVSFVPQMLRLVAGFAAPLAIVIFFKLHIGGPSDLFPQNSATILQRLADPGRWILAAQGLVIGMFRLGNFLVPVVLVAGLFWYLVRFKVDSRDRAGLSTIRIALALTILTELILDILFVQNLPVEIATSMDRNLLQLWPAGVLMFFLASGPLQLVAPKKNVHAAKVSKKTPKPVRRGQETRRA
jgi:hypothetical protein